MTDESRSAGVRPLEFIYCDAQKNEKVWHLYWWVEQGFYIRGRSDGDQFYRTFRKDRVIQYLSGGEQILEPDTAPPPKIERASKDNRSQILFTGFAKAERSELEAYAEENALRVVKTVTKDLTFLCCGSNAGAKKVDHARSNRIWIISRNQLEHLVVTGELPDESEPDC